MSAIQSHVTGRIIVAESREGDRRLFLQVDVDCPECGHFAFQLPGHHLRPLRDLCLDAIDRHPDLTGTDAGLQILKKTEFTGTPNDPTNN